VDSRLTPLQIRILRVLAPLRPRWTLTGGGALVGFHLGHRRTKDVDLFFHGQRVLDTLPVEAIGLLAADGLAVETDRQAPAFVRFRVSDGSEMVLADLVAEPVANAAPPERHDIGGSEILVDSAQEILGNKLGALYSRWEIRDLVDIRALVESGADLDAALSAAARKDGGFGRADLAWVLREMKVGALARAEGYDAEGLSRFARELTDKLLG
jgi:hypothetical protein